MLSQQFCKTLRYKVHTQNVKKPGVAYVFRAKRLTQTLYLLSFCPIVLMFSALAANLKHLRLVLAFGA